MVVRGRDGEEEQRSHSSQSNGSSRHNRTSSHSKNPDVVIDPRAGRNGEESWTGLDLSNRGLFKLTRRICYYPHLTALYLSSNNLTSVPDELFTHLTNLVHLDLSYNRITQIPPTVENLQQLKRLLLFSNRLTSLPVQIGRLWKLKQLSVENNPISEPPMHVLQKGTDEIFGYLRDRVPPCAAPPDRGWISYIENGYVPQDGNRFRIMSFNILAETYATSERHSYVPCWALSGDYRKQRILKEILQLDADIICLQEVEGKQFSEFFEPELRNEKYAGIFRPKSRARTMDNTANVDGCAMFFRKEKFRIIEDRLIEFQSLALSRFSELTGDRAGFERVMTKDNIAVAAVLEVLSRQGQRKSSKIIIANTHIHWDPDMSDVKLLQAQFLTEELSSLKAKIGEDCPMVVAGDFNSMPSSGVYSLLRDGYAPADHPAFQSYNFGKYTRDGTMHSLRLVSAYAPIGEPPFTNYNSDFMGVLDYLWYSEQSLRVLGVLQPYSLDDVMQQKSPLPNPHFPSDHIPIMAEMELL